MTSATDATHAGELYCPTCEQAFTAVDRCPADGTRLVRLTSAVDPFLGRELDGRYTILERLGQGGMGTVYRAHQHSVGRDVAVKVVTPSLVSSPDVIKRFLRECKLASRLSHPNAVGVLDFGQTDDGTFFLVMELVSGRTLDDVIAHERALRPERVIRIGAQICDALEGAHAMQIVHRDLKPSNVMLLATGRDLVKVLDFGLAKSLSPDSAQTTMTGTGALMGTPAYMPPELATGQECDARADLYSLGCVLYTLATGRPPFTSESVHELVMMHASEPAPPMPGPPALATVVDRLLRKQPDERYPSAAATREALEHAAAHLHTRPAAAAAETEISLGPFPATTGQFAHLASEPASVGTATTLDGSDVTATSPRRPRALLVGVAALAVIAIVAVVAIGGMRGRGSGARAAEPAPVTGSAVPTVVPDSGARAPEVVAPAITIDAGVPVVSGSATERRPGAGSGGRGERTRGTAGSLSGSGSVSGSGPFDSGLARARPTLRANGTPDPPPVLAGSGSATGSASGSGSGSGSRVPGSPDQETPPF